MSVIKKRKFSEDEDLVENVGTDWKTLLASGKFLEDYGDSRTQTHIPFKFEANGIENKIASSKHESILCYNNIR